MAATISDQLKGALFCAAKGFFVFPCKEGKKTPIFEGWQDWSTNDKEKILAFGKERPECNWGINCEKSGILAIDIDPKNGGDKSYEQIKKEHGAFDTFHTRTPSGGSHFLFAGIGRSTASAILPGVDTRGNGGYVVAPGSRLLDDNGDPIGSYVVVRDTDILAQLPEWVREKLGKRSKEPLPRPPDSETIDSIPEGQRDITLTRWAGVLRGQGLTAREMEATMLVFNEDRCNPPADEADVLRIVHSIGKKPRGEAEAIGLFAMAGVVEPKLKAHSAAAIRAMDIPPPNQAVADLADMGDVFAIFGKAKARKSWMALQLAVCLATGKDFLGIKVPKPRKVLLFQLEVQADHYNRRVQWMLDAMGIDKDDPLQGNLEVIHCRGHQMSVALIAEEAEARKPEAVIIDPLYPLIEGEENTAEGLRPVVRGLAKLADKLNCLIAYVHHDKKGKSGDMDLVDRGSGHSTLARAYDCALFIDPHADDDTLQVIQFMCRPYRQVQDRTVQWANYVFCVRTDTDAIVETSGTARAKAVRGKPVSSLLEQAKAALSDRKEWSWTSAEARLRAVLDIGRRKSIDILHALENETWFTTQTREHGAKFVVLEISQVEKMLS